MLSAEYTDLLADCTASLRQRADLTPVPEVELDRLSVELGQWALFGGRPQPEVLDAYELSAGSSTRYGLTALWVAYQLTRTESRHDPHGGAMTTTTHVEPYQLIRVSVTADFGHVTMRPETFSDKVAEVFRSREVDFDEHPVFSDRYYVLASDETKLRTAATVELLELLSQRQMIYEIQGSMLVAAVTQIMNKQDCIALAELALAIPGSVAR